MYSELCQKSNKKLSAIIFSEKISSYRFHLVGLSVDPTRNFRKIESSIGVTQGPFLDSVFLC